MPSRALNDYDVVIVGAGPAGTSMALALTAARPHLADRVLVLDRASHPREKVCGGGVTRGAEIVLAQLGAMQALSSSLKVSRLDLGFRGRDVSFRSGYVRRDSVFQIVRRSSFDLALLAEVKRRGVNVHERRSVHGVTISADHTCVHTERADIRAAIVVGADGATSAVRRAVGLRDPSRLMRTLEVLGDPTSPADSGSLSALIDFRCVLRGVRGYYWEFPSLADGGVRVKYGIGDLGRGTRRADLRQELARELTNRGVKADWQELRGHPIRWFDPAQAHSAHRVILIGDAAGTDPLLAEGITSALRFGVLGARATLRALEHNRFDFDGYERDISASLLGRVLAAKLGMARRFFSAGAPTRHLAAIWLWEWSLAGWPAAFGRSPSDHDQQV